MAVLTNQSKNTEIIGNLKVAHSFSERSKGLIGQKKLPKDNGLWIQKCNWIHTFFMSIPIDVVYVDKKMKVRKIQNHLKPWKLPAPVFLAHSVIELAAGTAENHSIEVGDTLHVGD